jgi:hypothetical protein
VSCDQNAYRTRSYGACAATSPGCRAYLLACGRCGSARSIIGGVVDDHELKSAADLGPDGSHGDVPVHGQVLSAQPSPNPVEIFRCTRLSGDLRRVGGGLPVVDGLVAGVADHEGLGPFPGHEGRLHGLARSRFSQAGELADSVHNDLGRIFAQFTSPSQEPGDQLLAEVRGGQPTTPGLPCPVTGVDSPIHTAALALHDPSGGPYHQN